MMAIFTSSGFGSFTKFYDGWYQIVFVHTERAWDLKMSLEWKNPYLNKLHINGTLVQRFSRAGPRGRGREWAILGVHPLSWLLSNNRLEEVCGTLTKGTFSSRLLLSNQDKGCTPSVVLPLALPLGPALHNLSNVSCLCVLAVPINLYYLQ